MHILAIILQIVLGLMFLFLGITSLAGAKKALENFAHIQVPTWFRYVTGLVQLVGAIGMIIGIWVPSYAFLAGIWLGITMLVGALLHVRIKDPFKETAPALVIMLLALIVSILNL